jgi:hypothetical protein
MKHVGPTNEIIKGTIVSISQTPMDMGVVLEKEKIELYFSFDVGRCMDYLVY